jgi:hypothetical protein
VRGPRRCHRSVASLPGLCVSIQPAPKTFYGRSYAAHASKAQSFGAKFQSTDTLSISTAMRRSLSWSSTASSTNGSQIMTQGELRFLSGLALGLFASPTTRFAVTSTPFSPESARNCVCRSTETHEPYPVSVLGSAFFLLEEGVRCRRKTATGKPLIPAPLPSGEGPSPPMPALRGLLRVSACYTSMVMAERFCHGRPRNSSGSRSPLGRF